VASADPMGIDSIARNRERRRSGHISPFITTIMPQVLPAIQGFVLLALGAFRRIPQNSTHSVRLSQIVQCFDPTLSPRRVPKKSEEGYGRPSYPKRRPVGSHRSVVRFRWLFAMDDYSEDCRMHLTSIKASAAFIWREMAATTTILVFGHFVLPSSPPAC